MNYWKEHPVYKNYECNQHGEIRNKTTKYVLKQHLFKGYLYVSITESVNNRKFISVHRFVMECFYGLNKLDVNHKNGIKTDNNIENLEWVTKSQNCIHREEVIKTGNSKAVKCIESNIIYNSTRDAWRKTNINQGNINQAALGHRKTAGGFHLVGEDSHFYKW